MIKGLTISDAVHKWVSEMNAHTVSLWMMEKVFL